MNKKFKYPKFLLLLITFIIAYILFSEKDLLHLRDILKPLGYFGAFLIGTLFTYGFTSGPATALFLVMAKDLNILLAGMIGGFGALCSDFIIFKFIRSSFSDEIKKLSREKLIIAIGKSIPHLIKRYVIMALAGFIIASPLPDELGVILCAASKRISIKWFALVSYIMNTIGIIVILLIGSVI